MCNTCVIYLLSQTSSWTKVASRRVAGSDKINCHAPHMEEGPEVVISFSEPCPSPNGWHATIRATRELTSPGGTRTNFSKSYKVATTPPLELKQSRKARKELNRQHKHRCLKQLVPKELLEEAVDLPRPPQLPMRCRMPPCFLPLFTHGFRAVRRLQKVCRPTRPFSSTAQSSRRSKQA